MQDRQQMMGPCRELPELYSANSKDFHTRLDTEEETWLHHTDPDTKNEFKMQWKCPG